MLISLIIGIAICYGLPITGLILLMRKRRGTGKAFVWGVASKRQVEGRKEGGLVASRYSCVLDRRSGF